MDLDGQSSAQIVWVLSSLSTSSGFEIIMQAGLRPWCRGLTSETLVPPPLAEAQALSHTHVKVSVARVANNTSHHRHPPTIPPTHPRLSKPRHHHRSSAAACLCALVCHRLPHPILSPLPSGDTPGVPACAAAPLLLLQSMVVVVLEAVVDTRQAIPWCGDVHSDMRQT